MSNHKSERIEWVDIAKGIGIILVILGHSVQFGGTVHNLIFSFHMPLFFILSGVVYRFRDNRTFLNKKLKGLLVPYIIFSIIGLVISMIIPSWRSGLSIRAILKDIYCANPNAVNVSSIWFLVCLFIVSMAFNFIQKYNKKSQCIIVGVCFILGVTYSKMISVWTFLPEGRLPFNIDTSLIALTFFAIGAWLRNYVVDRKVFIISCVTFVVSFLFNGRVNLHGLTFNNPVLYIMESISGTVIVIFLCSYILVKARRQVVIGLIEWLGRHTLIILGGQALAVRVYLLVVNEVESKDYYLYGLPAVHQVVCFISVMTLSIVVCMLFDIIRFRLRRNQYHLGEQQ